MILKSLLYFTLLFIRARTQSKPVLIFSQTVGQIKIYEKTLNVSDISDSSFILKCHLKKRNYYKINQFPLCALSPSVNFNKTDVQMKSIQSGLFRSYNVILKNSNESIIFDKEASITNSNIHQLQINGSNLTSNSMKIFVAILTDQFETYDLDVKVYQMKYNKDEQNQCLNDCQQYNMEKNNDSSIGFCDNNKCQCGYQLFGSYCQFSNIQIQLDNVYNALTYPQQWKYYFLELKNESSNDDDQILLEISKVSSQFYVAIGFEGIQDQQLPQYFLGNYYKQQQGVKNYVCYSLKEILKSYRIIINQQGNSKNNGITIGLYNDQDIQVTGSLRVFNQSQQNLKNFIKQNLLVFLVIFINIIIGISFLGYQQYSQRIVAQQLRSTRKKPKGFTLEFIKNYFPPIQYEDIISNYPDLEQVEECVICIEPMKLETTKNIIKQKDQENKKDLSPIKLIFQLTKKISIPEKLQTQQFELCSVIPCYHMFHHDCMVSWFLTSKICPICRQVYNEIEVTKMKAWLKLHPNTIGCVTSERNDLNQYAQRIKKSKKNRIQEINTSNNSSQFLNQSTSNIDINIMESANDQEQ